MKDNFSKLSREYALFRPSYPKELFDFLRSLIPKPMTAWDCGTGNGQVAVSLASFFETVYATDISENQLKNAVVKKNIIYKREEAEHSSFPDTIFDLITVAQAIHWFDFAQFYREVKRTLKPNGIIAVVGYPLPTIDAQTDYIIDHLYRNTLNGYWDEERKYIDERYRTIPFPFKEIAAPLFSARYNWSLEEFLGYLNTWSAVQHYKEKNNANPIDAITDDVRKCWNDTLTKDITFAMLLRVGAKPGN